MIEFNDFIKLFNLYLMGKMNSTLILIYDDYQVSPSYDGI